MGDVLHRRLWPAFLARVGRQAMLGTVNVDFDGTIALSDPTDTVLIAAILPGATSSRVVARQAHGASGRQVVS
jgi:hypothetical protein